MPLRRVVVLGVLGLASCKPGPAPIAPAEPAPQGAGPAQITPDDPAEPEGLPPGDRRILEGGVAALEAGEYDRARRVFNGLLDRYPNDEEILSLRARTEAAQAALEAKREAMRPVSLPKVAFRRFTERDAPVQQSPRAPKLRQVSKARNEIVDTARWFEDNALSMPTWEVPNPRMGRPGNLPAWIPRTLGEDTIVGAIRDPNHPIAMYARDYSGGTSIVVFDAEGGIERAFDFKNWSRGPKDDPKDRDFTEQRVNWALVRDGVLFVSTGHNTYAKSSGGLTGFVTALDLQSGNVLWRSDPLVANAVNFVYRDGYIISGYGFTSEPDFMYVLDARTGKTVSKTRIKSGPSYIIESSGQLFVRTYDTNYVFEVR